MECLVLVQNPLFYWLRKGPCDRGPEPVKLLSGRGSIKNPSLFPKFIPRYDRDKDGLPAPSPDLEDIPFLEMLDGKCLLRERDRQVNLKVERPFPLQVQPILNVG